MFFVVKRLGNETVMLRALYVLFNVFYVFRSPTEGGDGIEDAVTCPDRTFPALQLLRLQTLL